MSELVKCGYRKCKTKFKKKKLRAGVDKKYCCSKHGALERHLLELEHQSAQDFNARTPAKLKEAARIFASLHCVHYRECICGIRMNCFECLKKEIVQGAWMHEPGALYHHQDLHSLCLPSNGRGE